MKRHKKKERKKKPRRRTAACFSGSKWKKHRRRSCEQPQRSASDLIMHEFHFHCLKVVNRFALVTLVLFFFPSPIRNWAKLTLITLECVSVCTVQIRN